MTAADVEGAAVRADEAADRAAGEVVGILRPGAEIHLDRAAGAEHAWGRFADDLNVGRIDDLNIFAVFISPARGAAGERALHVKGVPVEIELEPFVGVDGERFARGDRHILQHGDDRKQIPPERHALRQRETFLEFGDCRGRVHGVGEGRIPRNGIDEILVVVVRVVGSVALLDGCRKALGDSAVRVERAAFKRGDAAARDRAVSARIDDRQIAVHGDDVAVVRRRLRAVEGIAVEVDGNGDACRNTQRQAADRRGDVFRQRDRACSGLQLLIQQLPRGSIAPDRGERHVLGDREILADVVDSAVIRPAAEVLVCGEVEDVGRVRKRIRRARGERNRA